jgi:hypothetical protein
MRSRETLSAAEVAFFLPRCEDARLTPRHRRTERQRIYSPGWRTLRRTRRQVTLSAISSLGSPKTLRER